MSLHQWCKRSGKLVVHGQVGAVDREQVAEEGGELRLLPALRGGEGGQEGGWVLEHPISIKQDRTNRRHGVGGPGFGHTASNPAARGRPAPIGCRAPPGSTSTTPAPQRARRKLTAGPWRSGRRRSTR